MSVTSEMLTSLSVVELEELADGVLAPARQARLDEPFAKNGGGSLSEDERRELEHLLELADQLTVLKTRARHTLDHLKQEPAGS